jgi:DNA-binding MurR/RpiR family transcriptional regulator
MQRASTFAELKEGISRAYPEMSKQLQRIARFALEKPNDLALGTVAALAEATQVQPSAMIRFANALGYGGFSEMQQVFRGHLVERSASYRERIDQMRRKGANGGNAGSGNGSSAGSADGVLHQLVGEAVAELGQLEEGVPAADMRAAVELIAGASRVHVLAQRRAFPVAGYIAYALAQMELRTHLLDGAGGMLRESLRAVAPEDVLVVASFRNYSPEVIEAAALCKERGVPVIAITDGALSPLKNSARVCFQLGDDSSRPFRSLVAPLCLAQALVMSTGHRLAEQPVKAGGKAGNRRPRHEKAAAQAARKGRA